MAGHTKWSEIKRRKGLTEAREEALREAESLIVGGERTRFRVQHEPDHGWILVRIPELQLHTQARTPAEIEPMARDVVATWLAAAPGVFDLDIDES